MLKRIRIQKYKSLVDLDLSLEPLTVILGPNASGKSNFLEVLQLLSRITSSQTLEDAFKPPYRGHPLESFTFGDEGIKSLLNMDKVSFSIEVDVQLSPTIIESVNKRIQEIKDTTNKDTKVKKETFSTRRLPVSEEYLRYRIQIEMHPKQGILCVADEYLAALSKKGQEKQNRKAFLERIGNRLHLRMEGQAHPLYYERYLDYSILSRLHYPPHYPHLTAMQHELSNWLTFYLEPREQMRFPNPVKAVHDNGSMGENLAAFLNTLKALNNRQFEAVEKSLHTMIPSITGINVSINELGEVELDIREGEKHISSRVLSEGTLRILGLLALSGAKEKPLLVGFEEPENGIHPRRISLIAEYLETRARLKDIQFVVTTHSPLLPDLISPKSLYVCRKNNGNTEIKPFIELVYAPLFKKGEIDAALEDQDELSPAERISRGDFDA